MGVPSGASLAVFQVLFFLGQCQEIEYPISSTGQCQIPGVCDGSNFDDIASDSIDQNDCLFTCQGRDTCQSWTYYPTQRECWTFRAPCTINYDPAVCADCTSGDVACDPLYQCRLQVECSGGSIVGNTNTNNGDECLAECQANSRCTWYTWDSSNSRCLLFDSCPSENPCSTCESGEELCSLSSAFIDFGKIMLTGGYDDEGYVSEILDVEGRFTSCDLPARVYQGGPIQLYGQAGAYIGGKVITCGGFDYNTNAAVKSCYEFALNDDNDGTGNDGDGGIGKWQLSTLQLNTARGGVGFVQLDETSMWVTGGYGPSSELDSTEIVTYTESGVGSSANSVRLPRATVNHCIIKVNNSAEAQEYVFLGGSNSNAAHYIDLNQANPAWQEFENPMPDAKQAPFCGYVDDGNGGNKRIVVSAGLTAFIDNTRTYIYSWTDNILTGTWADNGPTYPDSTSFGYSVPYKNTFLTGDGENSDGKIYMYNADLDNWGTAIETASTEHYYGTGILIPDSFYCHCGDEVEVTTGDLTTCSSASQGTRIGTHHEITDVVEEIEIAQSKSSRKMWWKFW